MHVPATEWKREDLDFMTSQQQISQKKSMYPVNAARLNLSR